MDSDLAIHTIKESCYRVGYPTYDAEYRRRKLINQSCDYAIECIEKLDKIKQIVKKELSPLSLDEMSNAESQIREVLEHESKETLGMIEEAPTADIIERARIDKALKEMDDLASHKVRPISFDQSVAVDMCINILKRSIEENND